VTSLLSRIEAVVGDDGVRVDADVLERHSVDWSRTAAQRPAAVIRPASSDQVAGVLALCRSAAQPIVVQGGLSGVCGAATPRRGEFALTLERMSAIEAVDTDGLLVVAEAGAILQRVQEAAAAAGLLFPLDLGARGSCTVGGNIATNAGGNRVIRYGTMRNLVLGLEVVLADGSVVPARQRILKDATGYDLKQWFIGAEGTLGVVTRATLRVEPRPQSANSALLAVPDFDAVRTVLSSLRRELVGGPSAFEVMWADYWQSVAATRARLGLSLDGAHAYFVLVEHEGFDDALDSERFAAALGRLVERGAIADAVVAQSARERDAFWQVRDAVADVLSAMRHPVTFDVGLAAAGMPRFLERLQRAFEARLPGTRAVHVAHLGDGTLHILADAVELAREHEVADVVYATVAELGASVSTEHGIGMLKRDYLRHSRSAAELAMMRGLKSLLDPSGILGRGRILSDPA
jgi:FAD/FMN-containing dehydrogenase